MPVILESFNQRVQEFAVHSSEDTERVKRDHNHQRPSYSSTVKRIQERYEITNESVD